MKALPKPHIQNSNAPSPIPNSKSTSTIPLNIPRIRIPVCKAQESSMPAADNGISRMRHAAKSCRRWHSPITQAHKEPGAESFVYKCILIRALAFSRGMRERAFESESPARVRADVFPCARRLKSVGIFRTAKKGRGEWGFFLRR